MEGSEEVTELGIPPPSAHQLLQPLLTSSLIPFPSIFPILYSTLVTLLGFARELDQIQLSIDETSESHDKMNSLVRNISELKVRNHLLFLYW